MCFATVKAPPGRYLTPLEDLHDRWGEFLRAADELVSARRGDLGAQLRIQARMNILGIPVDFPPRERICVEFVE